MALEAPPPPFLPRTAVVLAELKVHHDERAEGQYTGSHRSGT